MLKRNCNWRNYRLFLSHFCHWWNFNWEEGVPPAILPLATPMLQVRKTKNSSQIFREVSGVFERNFNCLKNSAVLEPRTGQFSRTWGFEAKAKDLTFEAKAKDFKMCLRGQGRPRGLHLGLLKVNFFMVFVYFSLRFIQYVFFFLYHSISKVKIHKLNKL